jgi:hypothetical protein
MENVLSLRTDEGDINWSKILTILGGLVALGVLPKKYGAPIALASIVVAILAS